MTLKRSTFSYKAFSVFTGLMLLFQYFSPVIGLLEVDGANAAGSISTEKSVYEQGDTVIISSTSLSTSKYYRLSIDPSGSTGRSWIDNSCVNSVGDFSISYTLASDAPEGNDWVVSLHERNSSCPTNTNTGVQSSDTFAVVIPTIPPITNPLLPDSCGVDMALVIDNSTSIDSGELSQMKTAMTSFVNAFAGTPTQFSVTSFATTATVRQTFTNDTALVISAINSIPVGGGYTNWEDGLVKAQGTYDPRITNPNLMVFSSDGNPNRVDNGTSVTESQAVAEAVLIANGIKTGGTRILALGIGNDLDLDNLKAISGTNVNTGITSDVITSDFSSLAVDLANLASLLCGGTITVNKFINDTNTPAGTGWDFVVAGEMVNTDSFGQTPAVDVDPGTYSVSEPFVNTGYIFGSASCKYQNGTPAGVPSTSFNGVHSIVVGNSDIISCNFINIEKAGVSGVKWNDLDGDGLKDNDEPTLPGWTIDVKNGTGSIVASAVTDSNGAYSISGLDPSHYSICEVEQTGWERTYPASSNCQNISIGAGQVLTDINFGNRGDLSISGKKFEYEIGYLNGWEITLTGTTSYGRTINENVDTSIDGSYLFDHLEPGSYTVAEENVTGWVHMDDSSVLVTLVDQNVVDVDFTNFKCATVSGYKFEDLDGDKTWEVGEYGLPGVTIEIRNSDDYYGSTVTGQDGYYEFSICEPGEFNVTEVLNSGWYKTWPSSTGYTVNVTSGAVIEYKNFGNAQFGQIYGAKFGDLNGNGIWDTEETGLSGWTIELRDTNGVVATTTTDSNGDYSFTNVSLDNLYYLWERLDLKPGWYQTTGPTSSFTLTSGQVFGDDISEITDFGNFELGSISGEKFHDIKADSVKDVTDDPVPGVKIELHKWMSGSYQKVGETYTDSGGEYYFTCLPAGTYKVIEFPTYPWNVSYPAMGINYYDGIVITSGLDVVDKDFGNYRNAELSGQKFHDLDADGSWDGGEPILDGWQIELLDSSKNPTGNSVYTQPGNGIYTFGVKPGTYYLREVLKTDWFQSAPSGDGLIGPITVESGGGESGFNFGNYQKAQLTVYKDVVAWDGSPASDSTEFTVELTGEGTKNIAEGNSKTYVDLNPGTYTLSETVIPSGYEFVSMNADDDPVAAGNQIILLSGEVTDITVVNRQLPSRIEVFKYEDKNGDSEFDNATESGLSNWNISLFSGYGCSGGPLIGPDYTDANGELTFSNLKPGRYSVKEETRNGWTNSTPVCVDIDLGVDDVDSVNFGNYRPGSISGMKFHDLNANGIKETEEPGLENWEIKLYEYDGEVYSILSDTVFTDSSGNYRFENIKPGKYRVQEAVQSDWFVSHPSAGQYYYDNFIINSGSNPTGADFGNYQKGGIIVHKDIVASDYSDVFDDPTLFQVGVADLPYQWAGEGDSDPSTDSPAMFGSLVPGAYPVYEVSEQPGYQLVSVTPDQVDVTSGDVFHVYITNRQLPSTIDVFKYEDIDGNGQYDEGTDLPIENWDFEIYEGMDCDLHEPEEPISVLSTNASGIVSFEGLNKGTYSVKEYLSDGWIYPGSTVNGWSSDTAVCETLTLGVNETKSISFGNFKLGKVSGYKFEDLDGDGNWDDGESPLPGWEICLEPVRDVIGDNLIAFGALFDLVAPNCVTTDIYGYYEFSNIHIGNYRLYEIIKDGWEQTVGPEDFEITSTGQVITDKNFGNRYITSDLSIEKIDDETEEKFNPGDRVTYTITVTNNGPYDAENVVVTDTLPADVEFAYYSMDKGTCDVLNGIITCNLGNLDVNDVITIIIGVDVSLIFKGELENYVSVTSDTPDSDTSNNEDNEFTEIVEKGEIKGEDTEKPKPKPEVLGETGQDIRNIMTLSLIGLVLSIAIYLNIKRKKYNN